MGGGCGPPPRREELFWGVRLACQCRSLPALKISTVVGEGSHLHLAAPVLLCKLAGRERFRPPDKAGLALARATTEAKY